MLGGVPTNVQTGSRRMLERAPTNAMPFGGRCQAAAVRDNIGTAVYHPVVFAFRPTRSFPTHAAPHPAVYPLPQRKGDASPSKSGDGPWIGRRLNMSEKLQLLHNSPCSESRPAGMDSDGAAAAAAAAGGWGKGGGGANRNSKLRISCYDELVRDCFCRR